MSDYHRLVSYIYSYPGGTRDKNVGFAKAEVRNGQFKLNVSLKGVYTDVPETFGVHLLIEDREKSLDSISLLPVGNVIVNGGSGQYTDLLNPSNISGSGYQFEDISGIAIARQDNDYYRMFSLWKDMEIKPELVKFLPKDYRNSETIMGDKRNEEIEKNNELRETYNSETGASPEAAAKMRAGSEPAEGAIRAGSEAAAVQIVTGSEPAEVQRIGKEKIEAQSIVELEEAGNGIGVGEKAIRDSRGVSEKATVETSVSAAESVPAGGEFLQAGMGRDKDTEQALKPKSSVTGEMGGIFDNADFIDVFGDDYYYDCVEVTPEQLQRLPIEDKAVVSNSFLEHGYYNFKHLLFGKVRENERHTKYFIGVPGMYCNRERFMATMFGYGNFKRSHRADCSNPYFGYWYQEI